MIEVDSEEVFIEYKYLPFNEGSLKVITEGTVKFTCPLEFNDPFDCQPVAYIDKQVRKKIISNGLNVKCHIFHQPSEYWKSIDCIVD